jgi:hypothetical protein
LSTSMVRKLKKVNGKMGSLLKSIKYPSE